MQSPVTWLTRPSSALSPCAHLQAGINGQHVYKGAPPPSQGVYNPVANTWIVPPANPRHIWGNSFAPATLFTRRTPATLRM